MRGFDALTVPDVSQYKTLRDLGFELACGYTRALTLPAITAALGLGMAVVPIDEAGQPTDISYFTAAQAQADGERFVAWAESVGMPRGLPFIGVPIDFDCPASAMVPVIRDYANVKIDVIAGRNPMWMYGPYDCIEAAKRWGGIAGFMQAQADLWSGGRNAVPHPVADIVQVGGATIAGIDLDIQVVRTGARFWRLA